MRKTKRYRLILLLIFSVLLLLLAAGIWAADYFLIPKVEKRDVAAPVEEPRQQTKQQDIRQYTKQDEAYPVVADHFPTELLDQPVEAGTGSPDDPEGTVIIGASDDGVNQIVITKTVAGTGEEKVTYYVADLRLQDIKELKTCFAEDIYGENVYERTSDMAKRCQAVFAVNGDCYGWRSDGIVIRNGELFRDEPARSGFAAYEDGHMECYEETSASGQDLADNHVWTTFTFGPALVKEGALPEALDRSHKYAVDIQSISRRNPRTAVGMISEGHYVFVVVDGRQAGYSRGMYLDELAELMQGLGCREAYNLDGGASVTMYFKGEVVNHSSYHSGDRPVTDCIFVN